MTSPRVLAALAFCYAGAVHAGSGPHCATASVEVEVLAPKVHLAAPWRRPHAVPGTQASLGLTASQLEWALGVEAVERCRPGAGCYACPLRVTVRATWSTTVRFWSFVQSSPCLLPFVARHEDQHVALRRQAAAATRPALTGALAPLLDRPHPLPVRRGQAPRAWAERLRPVAAEAFRTLLAQVDRGDAALDTPRSYLRSSQAMARACPEDWRSLLRRSTPRR